MKGMPIVLAGLLALATLSGTAEAQGIIGGANQGAAAGESTAGPIGGAVGAVVGGTVGGVVGGARGVLGLPRRHYVPGYRAYRRSQRRYYRHHHDYR